MAKWFKFEEKKPRTKVAIIVWHPRLGRYFARRDEEGFLRFDHSPAIPLQLVKELTHWQYAPKGPKEESEKS